jgi:late competence protein required for DNA uptake (superfamily II DNA/RNA helicase)
MGWIVITTLSDKETIMKIEKLRYKQPSAGLLCFRCQKMTAEYRVSMNIGEHGGKLIVCLCESCMQIPEAELYAFFVKGEK